MVDENKKKHLESISQEHKKAFEEELEDVIEGAKRTATSALIIGGGFALSYYIIGKLTKRKKIKHKKNPSKTGGNGKAVVIEKEPTALSNIGHLVLTEATIFLIAIAKEKVVDYIKNLNAEKEDEHPQNT